MEWKEVENECFSKREIEEAEVITVFTGELINRRCNLKMTCKELAHKAGVKKSSVTKLEKLDNSIANRLIDLYWIIDALGLEVQLVEKKEQIKED